MYHHNMKIMSKFQHSPIISNESVCEATSFLLLNAVYNDQSKSQS